MAAGQLELDFGLGAEGSGGPLAITSSRMGHLCDALSRAYEVLGFDVAAGGDEVFKALVLDPWRIGAIVAAALVLLHIDHTRTT